MDGMAVRALRQDTINCSAAISTCTKGASAASRCSACGECHPAYKRKDADACDDCNCTATCHLHLHRHNQYLRESRTWQIAGPSLARPNGHCNSMLSPAAPRSMHARNQENGNGNGLLAKAAVTAESTVGYTFGCNAGSALVAMAPVDGGEHSATGHHHLCRRSQDLRGELASGTGHRGS